MAENWEKSKIIYLPYLCDHNYALAAAMEYQGIAVEILPPPDDETLDIGLELCRGRECWPCFVLTGDIIRRARKPDFDPRKAIFFMVTTEGPCRIGQYMTLQKELLRQQGLGDIQFITPNAQNGYHGLGDRPTALRMLVWQGFVAVDLLQKLLHQYRPYELEKGMTDGLYQQSLARIVDAVRNGGGRKLQKTMGWIAAKFENLPVGRMSGRPLIGVVGEVYLRLNSYGNEDLVRKVEAAGGEVVLTTAMEFFYYTNWLVKNHVLEMKHFWQFLSINMSDQYQRYQENKLVKPVVHLLRFPHETPVKQLLKNLTSIVDPSLSTEAIMSMGKALDYAHMGLDGIMNILPFSCMPGIITAGMAPRLQMECAGIPWLDVIYDAQGGTNLNTRLEAFIFQAVQR